jgi:hypothetical protein
MPEALGRMEDEQARQSVVLQSAASRPFNISEVNVRWNITYVPSRDGSVMPSPPLLIRPEQPHLVSLVLQSKKALQHGEQLCSKANTLSNTSAQTALDVLALDAKIRWITDAVLEQLKVNLPPVLYELYLLVY